MSNLNLFGSKSNFNKISLPTDQISTSQQESNDSWHDLSDVTSTLLSDNQIDYLSPISSEKNSTSWQTVHDYATITKSYRLNGEPNSYCRLDRTGQWLLLSRRDLRNDDTSCPMTTDNNKYESKDSLSQPVEHTFPDSCESLIVSIDFHVPTEELIGENYDTHGKPMMTWKQTRRQFETKPSHKNDEITA